MQINYTYAISQIKLSYITICIFSLLFFSNNGFTQLTLPAGTEYSQDFNGIASGLPPGWTVRTGATSNTEFGTSATFITAAAGWSETAGSFKNGASTTGLTSASSPAAQSGSADRTLMTRQSGSVGDPGASFQLEILNTTGKQSFTLELNHLMLFVQSRSTTFSVQYAVGVVSVSNPFVTINTYVDPGVWGSTSTGLLTLPASFNNSSGPIYIRIAALTTSSGTGSRDSYGIEDFVLSWVNIPLPVTLLTFQTSANKHNQLLTWTYESPERFDYFEIDHSRDGKAFNALARVSEGEISSRAYKANYTHILPGAGIHYYRLKMVDLDDSFAYSQVIQGRIDGSISVRPLSTFISTEGINLSVENGVSALELRLVDQLGRTVYHSTQATEAGVINIPISNLGSGVYFLQVNADGVIETHKLVR